MENFCKPYIQSLLLHKFRSALSTLGILFGVASFITMLSIGEGAKEERMREIASLGLNNIIIRSLNQNGLAFKDAVFLSSNIPGTQAISPIQSVHSEMTAALKELNPEIIGVTKEYQRVQNLALARGRFISDLDVRQKKLVCVIGSELAMKLAVSGEVGKALRIGNQEHRIVGILQASSNSESQAVSLRDLDNTVIVPLDEDKAGLQEVHLKVKEKENIPAIASLSRHAIARLHKETDDTQFIIPQELLKQAEKAQRTFNLVLGSIAAVSLLVGGIGILNVMLASVYERKSEIGIRRAVGASRKNIITQFLGETCLLTIGGAFLGLILGIVLSLLISLIARWPTIITLYSVLTSLAVSFSIGIFSGLYPAIQAAKMDPIEALRN